MSRRHKNQRGNSLVEFTLVGIPLVFVLISIFEVARGMWIYHTVAYAVTEATRYASVHGVNCTSASGNNCSKTISDLGSIIEYAGIGLTPDQLSVSFVDHTGTISCKPLNSCLSPNANTTVWPRSGGGGNIPGMNITISASYPFSSAIAMFWPGAGAGVVFPTVNLPATSTERVQF
jgi:hypothetical protein